MRKLMTFLTKSLQKNSLARGHSTGIIRGIHHEGSASLPNMAPSDSFADVIARLQAGDDKAAREIVGRFTARLIALARTHLDQRLKQKVDPEDVLQSVYKSFFVRFAQGQFELKNWESLWGLLTI